MPEANLVLDLIVKRVDLVDEGANTAAFIKMYKRREQSANMELKDILAKMAAEHAKVIEDEIAKAKAMVPDATAAELEATKKEVAKAKEDFQAAFDEANVLKGKLAEEEAKKSKPDFEDVIKGLDPAVQEMMKTMKAKADVAEEQLRKAKADQLHQEAVAKAKELANLPVEEAKLVEVLKGASAEVTEVLKSVSAAIADGKIFEEVGKRGGDGGKPSSADEAWAKIEKMAGELAKAENITIEKARGEVTKRNPELYKAYLDGGAN